MKNYLSTLLSKLSSSPSVLDPPKIPEGKRLYCIGDIHGRVDLLLTLTTIISKDAFQYKGEKVIVLLGDYIDRGMKSKEVIDLLIHTCFLPHFEKIFLCGNHEQALLDFLNGDSGVLKDWWRYGAQTTFFSYGVPLPGIPAETKYTELQAQLHDAIPAKHLTFFEQLRGYYLEGDYCFVHAGIKPGVSIANQKESDLFWIREEFLNSKKQHEKIIVHGHTISDEPEFLSNRIGLDTGAYLSGNLTCLVLENETQRILNTLPSLNPEKISNHTA